MNHGNNLLWQLIGTKKENRQGNAAVIARKLRVTLPALCFTARRSRLGNLEQPNCAAPL
jgi:hypothetical protein